MPPCAPSRTCGSSCLTRSSLRQGAPPRRRHAAQLDPLAALAQAHEIAMLAVLQPTGADRGARKAAPFDTLALEAARAAFAIAIDPADEKRRLLLQMKNELAPERGTPAFRITGREIEPGQTAARLEFEPQYNPLSAREFMARQGRSFDSERAEAIEFLRSLLGSAATANPPSRAGSARLRPARRQPAAEQMPGAARRPHAHGSRDDPRSR